MREWVSSELDTIPRALDPLAYGKNGKGGEFPHPCDLAIRVAASFHGEPVPERPWLVPKLIPRRTVTLLSGNGGDGKSLLAEQLAVAASTGTDWCGTMPERGPVLFVSAEDEEAELHRRLVDIVASRELSLADLDQLHILSLSGEDALLCAPAGRAGGIVATPLWHNLAGRIEALRPRLVVLDTAADVFGGNEITRADVRGFVAMLRGLAERMDAAVLLLSHPSVAGINSGTGLSGSTAWNNSVRSRLYLQRITDEDGKENDPALRVLSVKKSNYGETGAEIRLRWERGAFRLDGGATTGFHRVAREGEAENVFLELLREFTTQARSVSEKSCPTYAPNAFAKTPKGSKIGKRAFAAAMERLFAAGKIVVEETGPSSRRRSRIVESSAVAQEIDDACLISESCGMGHQTQKMG